MNFSLCRFSTLRWIAAGLAAAGSFLAQSACGSNATNPVIQSIDLTDSNVVVTVSVPSGLHKFTLESRSRLGAGTWIPAAVVRTDGAATNLVYTLPRQPSLEVLRLRADVTDPLPGAFYQGTNRFTGPLSTSNPASSVSGLALAPGAAGAGTVATVTSSTTTRAVVESDIWQFNGSQLLYFNQRRGLQVIDISRPSAPVLKSTLSLPAQGNQMYLLDTNHAVLITQNYCDSSGSQNQIVIVELTDQGPVLENIVNVPGLWSDSRMVGTVLYLASEGYIQVGPSTNATWEWATSVTSVDLTDPANPVIRDTQQVQGYGNLVYATDEYFFVVTSSPATYYASDVQIFDISDPTGLMAQLPSVKLPGSVQDKFGLNYQKGVFSAISFTWNYPEQWVTSLNNFVASSDGSSFSPSGSLHLAQGQLLHANQFDGTRVYIVTAVERDPLWVVDNSNPAEPVIAGSVDTPGWSSFIRPMGDQLVTIGVDTNLVDVSLFDVSNPSMPQLLSRIDLGSEYSWSLANWDDKAFNVLPDAGLILVPYSDYGTNGYSSQVQLIDLGTSSLTMRGVISHAMQPDRTAVNGNTVFAITDADLLSVDASNRDMPSVNADIDLAWDVSAIIARGDYLVQVSENDPGAPELRVTATNDAQTVLGSVVLTNLPVLGVTSQGQYAYVIQGARFLFYFPIMFSLTPFDGWTNGFPLTLSVIDMTQLPNISVVGQTEIVSTNLFWGGSLSPLWLTNGTLVWSGSQQYYLPLAIAASPFIPAWWSSGGSFLAYDVSNPAAPNLVSTLQAGTNAWGFGTPFAVGDLIYTSFETSEEITVTNWPVLPGGSTGINPGGPIIWPSNPPTTLPFTYWMTLNSLQVIDYSDPANPTMRLPVSLPNPLIGVSPDGNIVYTQGSHPNPTNYFDWSQTYIDASAYDGVSAYLLDSIVLPNSWPQATLFFGTNVLISHVNTGSSSTSSSTNLLDLWTLSSTGSFVLENSVTLPTAPYSLAGFGSNLVLGQSSYDSLMSFDLSAAPTIKPLTVSGLNECLWFSLNGIAGSSTNGLWVPLGYYGTQKMTLSP